MHGWVRILSFALAMTAAAAASPAREEGRPLVAVMAGDGVVTVRDGDRVVAYINPRVALKGWNWVDLSRGRRPAAGKRGRVTELPGGGSISYEAGGGGEGRELSIRYRIATAATLEVDSVNADVYLPVEGWLGAAFTVAGKRGTVPEKAGDVVLAEGAGTRLALEPARSRKGPRFELVTPRPARLFLQDSRQWAPGLDVRVMEAGTDGGTWTWRPGRSVEFEFRVAFGRRIRFEYERPVTVRAGKDWFPLEASPEVAPGSALDWAGQGLTRTPAGVLGWLRVQDGRFVFEKEPGRAVRFYGVNLTTGACFPSREEADLLAERLARRGYNSVRFHHHESAPWVPEQGLMDPRSPGGLGFNGRNLERFDYFFAALKKRGIYSTTDLYVSRMVPASVVWPGDPGDISFRFKHLICVSEAAMENWKEYCRRLLSHVNPHTGLAYRDDPALPLLCLVNEGNLTNDVEDLRKDPREGSLWARAFTDWKGRNRVQGDWGGPEFHRFLWEVHRATERRQLDFLRKELGVRALLTDLNGWTDEWGTQTDRTAFDYVDNHMYWDHPRFLEGDWGLPATGWSGGGSAIRAGAPGGDKALTRLADKPFTITEFHFVPPNRFRAESGFLYGAYAAVQDWSGLWRFCYSGDSAQTMRPGPLDWFNVVNDPLTQAAEYAAVALFLRGDLPPSPLMLGIAGSAEEHQARAGETVPGSLGAAGWLWRISSAVACMPASPQAPSRRTFALGDVPGPERLRGLVKELKREGELPAGNATNPETGVWESPDGGAKVESGAGVMTVATPRTAGVAGPGGTTRIAGPLRVTLGGSGGVLWASSVDGKGLSSSRRILFVHLTDLANTGIRFRDMSKTVLEEWGSLPYLVRAGRAGVRLAHERPAGLKVWRLDTSGRRTGRVETGTGGGFIEFAAETAFGGKATLFYEMARQ